jgi:fumarate reductase flavoprotein subunit
LVNESRKLGAELFTQAPVREIITSKEGKITGVVAKKDGKDFIVTTGTVIIATGGYGGNKRMLKKYCPDYRDNMKLIGIGYSGDGFRIATELGAAQDGLGVMQLFGPCIDFTDRSLQLNLGSPPDTFTIPLLSMISEPSVIWVNKQGKRYIDETVFGPTAANATIRQPGNLSYTLFDSNVVNTFTEHGLFMGGSKFKETRGKKLIGLEKELRAHAEKGLLTIANSWNEIAEWIGTDSDSLKATIDLYNNDCEHGHDSIFLKNRRFLVPMSTPPFYSIETRAEFHGTIGGIKINEKMEVIDNQDNPIPGLYAAGVDVGGWQTETYGPLPGTAFGFAVNSGRIAGEKAAEYVR